jgi:hypothetical protein
MNMTKWYEFGGFSMEYDNGSGYFEHGGVYPTRQKAIAEGDSIPWATTYKVTLVTLVDGEWVPVKWKAPELFEVIPTFAFDPN